MKILFLFIALLLPVLAKSQEDKNWGLELRAKGGFLMAHRPVMGHLGTEHAIAGELSYVFRPGNQRIWYDKFGKPDFGVTLFAGTVGNNEVLGQYYGLYSFINFPFVRKKSFRFNGKIACGLGAGTKHYDPVTNPKNVAVSSPLNALICLGLDARYQFNKEWISLGIDMTHFSNGAFKVPNLGINVPYLSLGFGHFVHVQEETVDVPMNLTYSVPQRKVLFGMTGIISAKEVFPTSGKKYPVYALNFNARTFLNGKSGWELSADFISKQAIFGYRPEIPKTQKDIFQMGIFGAYLLQLDKLHIVLGMGAYVRDKYHPEDPMYHRVGFRYYLKNAMNINVTLKSHWARADYVEWGLGYTFNYKKK